MNVSDHLPIRALILDMDGVLWKENTPIGDLEKIFRRIESAGIKIMLATNNATRTPEQYQEKLASFKVHIAAHQIVNSATAVAIYLKNRFPNGGKIFVVGESGLKQAIQDQGFEISADNPLAVAAGLDRQITYEKLKIATLLIRSGVPFIGSNPDRTFPSPEGLIPGAGTVLAAIEASTDVKPEIVGKPFTTLYQIALDRLGTNPAETLAVGDRLDTDILGGYRAGCKTGLVLTGVSTLEELRSWSPQPDIIASDLESLVESVISYNHGS